MSSAAEQLAANMNWSSFSKAKELKNRIWFTLIALTIYRVGTYIPLPGVNPSLYAQAFENQQGGILGIFNVFTGGAFGRMTIFALNVMPYITASIIMQMMSTMSKSLSEIKKEGESGRKKINQYTRYLTVLLTITQSSFIITFLESTGAVIEAGWMFRISTVITLVGATMFLLWLGEQMTARGIGNGISLIIFSGIVANLPSALFSTLELGRTGVLHPALILLFLFGSMAVVTFIVFIERAQRRILIQYPKRQVGQKMYGGESSHLPMKLNTSGVIPPIFASALLLLPATIAGFGAGESEFLRSVLAYMGHGQPLYIVFFVFLICFFGFFYTAIVFNPEETSENLKKNGGYVPGIRPGKNTAEYFDRVLTRLTVVGVMYLSAICILPEILISQYSIPFYFGGTSLLIVVTVMMDTVTQIHSHMMAHQYEGLIKKSKLKSSGKRRR